MDSLEVAFDISFVDHVNAITGALVVIASYIFGEHWMLFAAFLILNLLDYITGLAKSKVLKIENSKAGLNGILKKFGYWVILAIAFILAPIFNELGGILGFDVSGLSPFIGFMVLAMLIVNEFRSILENLVECGINVPTALVKGLKVFEDVTNSATEHIFDGELDIDKHSQEHYHVQLDTSLEELEKRDSVTLHIRTISDEEE